ncbi:MAG TPA: aldo/keto reductase [Candidatus Aquilonibacter sp.]|nr:aldo/keto reductase [Candidatus Aquilonibacter sp.]
MEMQLAVMITELSGKKIFPIGIGTWGMGGWMLADNKNDKKEIAAIKFAIESGINAIDTAELYGRGHAEELVAEAIKGFDRETLHITSKVWPTHLSRSGINGAVNASLKRLGTKYLDLYLIHWPNPLANMQEAISTMEELIDGGLIRSMGVSNFGVSDMQKALDATKKHKIEVNQIEYSVLNKEPEQNVIPFCEKNKVKIVAYTPLAKGAVNNSKEILKIAGKYKKTPIQVAINYLLKSSLPIPKASTPEHIREIMGSTGWELKKEDYAHLKAV